jgi:hypothetical protein
MFNVQPQYLKNKRLLVWNSFPDWKFYEYIAKFNKVDSESLKEFNLSFNIPSPVLESAHMHTKWLPTGLIANLQKNTYLKIKINS